jgi:Fe-S oxidoreductase
VPVVGLEPSCLAVFRDELAGLLPDDARAGRLAKNCFTLAEYLGNIGYTPPLLNAQVLMQGHCHQKAVLGMPPTDKLLAAMGARVSQPESGCCGMAGGFGFNPAHVGMSMAIGERALLPAVRSAAGDTVLLADGFSCREQIEQGTGKQTQHLAEVILAAIEGNR